MSEASSILQGQIQTVWSKLMIVWRESMNHSCGHTTRQHCSVTHNHSCNLCEWPVRQLARSGLSCYTAYWLWGIGQGCPMEYIGQPCPMPHSQGSGSADWIISV